MSNTRFTASKPRIWSGKYSRIPGDNSTLHVTMVDGRWQPNARRSIGADTAQCNMVISSASTALASAVIDGKKLLGGSDGGSFLINEFGQVLVPAQNYSTRSGNQIALVGTISGPLMFNDPFSNDAPFDFSDTSILQSGSAWERPYVGLQYNLSKSNEIYFWDYTSTAGKKVVPPIQDSALISAIRQIRPRKAVRFLVSYNGIVLTKVPVGDLSEEFWEPRYVGRINKRRWFAKEV